MTPDETLIDYTRAFASLDARQVVPFFEVPCLFVSSANSVSTATIEAVEGVVQALVAQASHSNYARTEIIDLVTRSLGAALHWLAGTFVRYDAFGVEVARFGFSYVMRRRDDQWRIVVALAHEV